MAIQVKPASYFPLVPDPNPDDTYDAIVQTARKEYDKFAFYTEKRAEIEALVKTWKEHWIAVEKADPKPPAEELEEEVWSKIDVYIGYQKVRDDLQKIIKIYDDVIGRCIPPPLEVETLSVLQNLKFKIEDIRASYDKVFSDDRTQLIDQRKRMSELSDKITPAVVDLRKSLEPLVSICCKSKWIGPTVTSINSVGAAASYLVSFGERTPYVNWAVKRRKQENAQAAAERAHVLEAASQPAAALAPAAAAQMQPSKPPPPPGPPPAPTYVQALVGVPAAAAPHPA